MTKDEREQLISEMMENEDVKQKTVGSTDEQRREYINNLIDIYEILEQDAKRYGKN